MDGDMLTALHLLADGWETQYHKLRADREENESCQDEIDDAMADVYLECAERIRNLLPEEAT